MEVKLKSIGFARNDEKPHTGGWKNIKTDIVIDKKYEEALFGLDGYSHLVVVYFMDKVTSCDLRHTPQGKVGIVPKVGIFACRCPERPNPIGVSTVNIVKIKRNVITVSGLDVIDKTPIVDIKPYTPQYDAPKGVKVPGWVNKLAY